MCESTGEEQECPDQKEHQNTSTVDGVSCVSVESDGIVPAEEDENSHQTVPQQFNNDVREHEGLPAVGLGGAFAYFIKISLDNEMRHHLLDELTKDSEQQENAEELILEGLDGCASVEEGETDEEGGKDTECYL